MKKGISYLCLSFVLLAMFSCNTAKEGANQEALTLKDAFNNKFLIGTALNVDQVSGKDSLGAEVAKKQFSSIVAENCMKSMYLQPKEGEFFFDEADKFVEFGKQNNMHLVGHTLIWHSQAPDWFFVDEQGKDVSREVLIERMKNHITTVVSRYKGVIKGWDVVNEAVLDDGSLRNSKFLEIIGEDYIKLAFQFAHKADPDAELYYNDFSMAHEAKCQGVVKMVKKLQEDSVRIDAIGMQGHMIMSFPSTEAFEKSLLAFSDLGIDVMITEMDISILPNPKQDAGAEISNKVQYQKEMNPYGDGLPEKEAAELENRYLDFFKLFIKHQDKISRVTLWGVSDANSWRNDWPMKGRTDYPLLFDRQYKAKPVVEKIIELATAKNEKK